MSEEKISATSRYFNIPHATFVDEKGETISYLKRRFIPEANGSEMARYTVSEGDRADTIANRTLGDPEQYWRICDSNAAMHPRDVTDEINRTLKISVSGGQGV